MKETLDYEGLSNLNKLYSIQVQATVSQTNFTNILLKKNLLYCLLFQIFSLLAIDTCIFVVEDTLYFSNVHSEFRTIRSTLQRGEQAVSFYL